MKKTLLIFILYACSTTVFAQTNTWTGAGANSNWNTIENWSLNAVPTAENDVVIPTGSNVLINMLASVKSIAIQGSAVLNLNGALVYTDESTTAPASTVNWNNGFINGGNTFTNNGTFNLLMSAGKSFIGSATFNNLGTFNIAGSGDFNLGDGTFNNEVSGTIDLRADEGDINYFDTGSHIINNYGLIKRTTSTGSARIYVTLNNYGGTIAVESGILYLNSLEKTLIDPILNVSSEGLLQWTGIVNIIGTLTGNIEGELKWGGEVAVPENIIAILDFSGNGLSWVAGKLSGGGTLVNKGLIKLTTINIKSIIEITTLTNEGDFIMNGAGGINLTDGIFNNELTGVIDLQNTGAIYLSDGFTHILNNAGLIKKTTSDGTAYISAVLNNNGGTIHVESGVLGFNFTNKYLNDGFYNVDAGCGLRWQSNIKPTGTLTGVIDGLLELRGGIIVAPTTVATLNFSGSSDIDWSDGVLSGGGTLNIQSPVHLSTYENKGIVDGSTLNNESDFVMTGSGDFDIYNGTFNNQSTGTIDMQENECNFKNSGVLFGLLNNYGVLKRTTSTGNARITTDINNEGIIDVQSGFLFFPETEIFTNADNGIIKGVGTAVLGNHSYYTNNGTFSPGGSPGTLMVSGRYESENNAVLDVELNGLMRDIDHDVLAITGTNAIFNGTINVTLGFAPSLNDEFIVATTTGIISQCNLATTTLADFDGMTYTFDVFCRNSNEVVLKVNNITLGNIDFEFSESNIQLYPNPVHNMLTIKNVNNLELETAQITDITGKVITSFDLKNMGLTQDISLENISSGMYFLKINGLNSSITKRVIKQ